MLRNAVQSTYQAGAKADLFAVAAGTLHNSLTSVAYDASADTAV